MKTQFLSMFLSAAAVLTCAQAAQPAPESMAGKSLVVLLDEVQVCRTDMYAEAQGPWYDQRLDIPLLLRFPAQDNTYIAPHPHNNEETTWPNITVSYAAAEDRSEAYVKVENAIFQALVVLTFEKETPAPQGGSNILEGSAYVYWHEDCETRHMRAATFLVRDAWQYDPAIQLPGADTADGDPELLDDGLNDILMALEKTTYTSATERLFQKRLVAMLPQIMVLHNPSFTSPDYKGNTALHYACGLSHVELVQWLVDHGADTYARTEKGASVDACISGPNAAAIRAILRKARHHK